MTLLEQTYTTLKQAQLTDNAEQFSTCYLGKSKNWYAVQRHVRRDFSIASAIACVKKIRSLSHNTLPLTDEQMAIAYTTEVQLMAYLRSRYQVADVC